MLQANIEPVQVAGRTATVINVIGAWINQFGSDGYANIHWVLFTDSSEDGEQVDSGVVALEGPDYDSWGADDNYVVNLTASKLGLTVVNDKSTP